MVFHDDDFRIFKELFGSELARIDVWTDTFAAVLSRPRDHMPRPGFELNRREQNHLHRLYLNALSAALRQSKASIPGKAA